MSAEVIPFDRLTYGELVAAEVRAQAARKRITGAKLAAALDMSAMSMSRRITGRQPFDIDELADVARVLGVRVQDLLPAQRTAAPANRDGGHGVAGVGFEPTTSGLRAPVLSIVRDGLTKADFGLAS